jgi:lambda family phage portal protein
MRLFGLNITRARATRAKRRASTPAAGLTLRSFLTAARLAAGKGKVPVPTTPGRIDHYIANHWPSIVAACQHEAEHGDHARKFTQLVRDNVVGPKGLTLYPKITDPDGTPDIPASDAIKTAWLAWRRKDLCEVTGAEALSDLERKIISAIAHTGEFLLRLCYGPEASPYGFALQHLNPCRLDPAHVEDTGGPTFIKHGIEFNRLGRPLAYWLRKNTPETDLHGYGYGSAASGEFEVIPAAEIIHGFIPEYEGQKRGLPQLRSAVGRLNKLGDFEDAATINARVGASKMGFITPDKDSEPHPDLDADGMLNFDATPAEILRINGQFAQFTPQFPDAAIEPFTKALLRSTAAGLGVSYNNLASDLTSVNFSSLRQGALDEREYWKGLQEWFVNAYAHPVFTAWLDYSLLARKITINGHPLRPYDAAKYRAVEFRGRRWGWIDPVAEMTAAEKALNLNLKSRTQLIADLDGGDAWDVWNERATEEQDMRDLGLDPRINMPGNTNTAPPPAKPDKPDDDPDDDKKDAAKPDDDKKDDDDDTP